MARSMLKVPDEVRSILASSTITGNQLVLPAQLDRKLYMATDKILKAAGGKWNRSAQAHVFASDPREVLGIAIETGNVADKKTGLQQFFSPPEVCRQLARNLQSQAMGDCDGMLVLEPSAGTGNLLDAITPALKPQDVFCVEIDPENTAVLRKKWKHVHERDFLEVTLDDFPQRVIDNGGFDVILMNPPFDRNEWRRHVVHAANMLAPCGYLQSVIPGTDDTKVRDLIGKRFEFIACEELPDNAFKASGTAVKTSVLEIRRPFELKA